jgi:hypothetical protein
MALAARSLPVPVYAVSNTVDAGLAARRDLTFRIAGELPMMASKLCSRRGLPRSARTSRRSRLAVCRVFKNLFI